MRDIFIKLVTTLWIIASLLVLLVCWFMGYQILGMYLFLGSIVVLVVAIILLARKYKNGDEDTITNAGRIARQSKYVSTKNVYENSSDIWNQMTGETDKK